MYPKRYEENNSSCKLSAGNSPKKHSEYIHFLLEGQDQNSKYLQRIHLK